ncbi:MAG: hypothetical protein ACN6PC_00105, partial [Pseudomonas putida]
MISILIGKELAMCCLFWPIAGKPSPTGIESITEFVTSTDPVGEWLARDSDLSVAEGLSASPAYPATA